MGLLGNYRSDTNRGLADFYNAVESKTDNLIKIHQQEGLIDFWLILKYLKKFLLIINIKAKYKSAIDLHYDC